MIILPSIPMVIYALVADASIGYLFLGGVIPGLMLGLAFMVMNAVIARRRRYPVEPPVPMSEIPRATVNAFPALLLPVILLFGIYGPWRERLRRRRSCRRRSADRLGGLVINNAEDVKRTVADADGCRAIAISCATALT